MAHARFLAAVLSFCASGATLLAGPTLIVEREALGAARPAKATARTTRARRSSDPPSGARRATPTPRGEERSSAKSAPESASNTKSAPTDERAPTTPDGAKVVSDPGASGANAATSPSAVNASRTPNRSSEARPNRGADVGSASSADSEQGAAKTPIEARGRVSDARGNANERRNILGDPRGDANESRTITREVRGRGKGDGKSLERVGTGASGEEANEPSRPDAVAPIARRELAALATGASALSAARPVVVALEGPVFDGGDVPRAAAALDRMKSAFGKCASIENALTKSEGAIDLRFLVRAPGRAEGVDVDKARGVSSDVVRCMTSVLARSYVGAPSDDPVGVAVTVRVKRPEPTSN